MALVYDGRGVGSMYAGTPNIPRGPQRGPNVSMFVDPAPPQHSNVIFQGAFEFIQHAYKCPVWGDDEAYKQTAQGMLCFAVKEQDPIYDTTTILTLNKVNQIAYDAYQDYRLWLDEERASGGGEATEFQGWLAKYGEAGLEAYHRAVRAGGARYEEMKKTKELGQFYEAAQKDMFCWLTRFGILSKITFLGSVINTNRAAGYNDANPADYFATVNVCLAKRAEISNVFGPADRITAGSKLWLVLRRKLVETRGGDRQWAPPAVRVTLR
jgi:hypothetical protein